MKNEFLQKFCAFCKEKQTLITYIFLFVVITSFIFCYFKNREKIIIPYFSSNYSIVAINIETNKPLKNLLLLKTNENDLFFLKPAIDNKSKKAQVTSFTSNMPLYNTGIAFFSKDKDEVLNNISNLSIFIGKDYWSFDQKQIKKLKKEIYVNGINNFTVIQFPPEVTKVKYSKCINYKGVINEAKVFLLSLFYCWRIYIIPWVLLIFGLFLFKKNPLEKFRFFPIFTIFLIGLLIRLNMCAEIGFWWDEHYITVFTGSPFTPWTQIFEDPGNPPLFALVSKIWFKIGNYTLEWARLLPVITGSLSLLSLYLLTKDRINKTVALLSTFLICISIYHISYSQEYRSYALSLFLVPLVVYFLFKFLEKDSSKNIFGFIITSILLINNHLFGLLVAFFNFVYGIFYYAKGQQSKTKTLNFILTNIIIALSFMPYAILTFIKKGLLDGKYNDWITPFSLDRVNLIININFGNHYILGGLILLYAIVLFTIKFNPKIKLFEIPEKKVLEFLTYLIYLITFIYVFTILFSIKRSILVPYYYIIVYPFLILLMTSLVCLKWKHKIINFILSFLLIISFGSITFNNEWKSSRAYNFLSNIAITQATLHPDFAIIGMVDPVDYAKILPTKSTNLIWQGNYNSLKNNEPKFTKYIINLKKQNSEKFNKQLKVIILVSYSELNNHDKSNLMNGSISEDIEYFSAPTAFGNNVVKITIEPK